MLLNLTSSQSEVTKTIKLEGDAFTTPIDLEDLNSYIREFAQDNGVTESSVSYEVLPYQRIVRFYRKYKNVTGRNVDIRV